MYQILYLKVASISGKLVQEELLITYYKLVQGKLLITYDL